MAAENIQVDIGEDYTQVHLDLAEALEEILKNRKYSDTWLDVVDELVTSLSGKVVFMAKEDHDTMVLELRALTAKP